MPILIFNRSSKETADYKRWLSDLNEEIYLVTSISNMNQFQGYDKIMGYEGFYSNNNPDIDILELSRSTFFSRIVATSELDIIRAANLRHKLGIVGQNIESAIAFRDKVVMKTILQNKKIDVPQFIALDNPIRLYEFIEENGFPIVIKPRMGMGGRDTTILNNITELKEYLKKGIPTGMMAETFIFGEMYHINGLIINYKPEYISIGKYVNDCLDFQEKKGTGSTITSPDSDMYLLLKNYINEVIDCLPSPQFSAFHCEVFITPDNQVIFCEIASRAAGGRITEAIRQTFGLDINEAFVRLTAGLNVEVPSIQEKPSKLHGEYEIPKNKGILEFIPNELPFEWITEYICKGKIGKRYDDMLTVSDGIGSVVVEGETEDIVIERILHIEKWFQHEIKWGE